MARSILAGVNPAVLRWARATVGLSQVAASRKLGLPDDRVASWETGARQPTVADLKNATKVYRRALSVFFLTEPPEDFDTLRDFRRHVGAAAGPWSPELHGEFRRALDQRDRALELAELDDAPPVTTWLLDQLPPTDAGMAQAMREHLLAAGPSPLPTGAGGKYDHLNTWMAALEESGVLVMHTSRGAVATDEMRALSIYFDEHPVIMLNGADSVRARTFSLMHEYAHLLLHESGICDLITDHAATTPSRRFEARCNAIAAMVLMPTDAVLSMRVVAANAENQSAWEYSALREAGARFGVSAEAFARRLLTLGRVDQAFYSMTRESLLSYQRDEDAPMRKGGSFYNNTARDLGKGFVRRIASARQRHVIDSYTAATLLQVKVGQIEKLTKVATISEPA